MICRLDRFGTVCCHNAICPDQTLVCLAPHDFVSCVFLGRAVSGGGHLGRQAGGGDGGAGLGPDMLAAAWGSNGGKDWRYNSSGIVGLV